MKLLKKAIYYIILIAPIVVRSQDRIDYHYQENEDSSIQLILCHNNTYEISDISVSDSTALIENISSGTWQQKNMRITLIDTISNKNNSYKIKYIDSQTLSCRSIRHLIKASKLILTFSINIDSRKVILPAIDGFDEIEMPE